MQLALFDARKCQVVEMRFFAGLAAKEIAVVLKTTEATVRRDWVIAKAWLFRYLEGHTHGMSAGGGNPKWEDVEQAMATWLELPEEQRSAYLARQSASVRGEVESLLAAYGRSGGFLGGETGKPVAIAELLGKLKTIAAAVSAEPLATGTRPAAPGSEGAGGSRPAISVDLGTQLGPYRLDTVIGKGGMGVVYRAVDTRLNRTVAVKFLFDDLADAASRRRFQREAQTASSLNHPHILTVHDAGDFEGRQYLVTEFVDGGTLKDWARAEKRTWREIVALLVGVADGLAAAHAAGILHRDIKPDNILVGEQRLRQAVGFWPRQTRGAHRAGDSHPNPRLHDHAAGNDPGDHRLHVAGAGLGPAHRRAQRHLLLRHCAL